MADHFQFLREVPFFRSLQDADIHTIQNTCREDRFAAGEVIFHEGDTGHDLFIICEGSVEIWKSYGEETADLLSVYGPGQIFGELALIDDSPRSATVVARQPCLLLSINRSSFDRITGNNPFSRSIMLSLSTMIRRRTESFTQGLQIRNRKLEKAYEQLKESEARRTASIQQKESHLREIHQRVNNTLQVIINVLGLRAGPIEDMQMISTFQACQDRLQALALVHDLLFRSPDLSSVDAGLYIHKVVRNLYDSFGESFSAIRIFVDAGGETLYMDDAVPLGLIINELVTNAFRYAFPETRKGEVWITLRSDNENRMILSVIDNGAGLPAVLDLDRLNTLGLSIVKGLAENQLSGTLTFRQDSMTRFIVRFSPNRKAIPDRQNADSFYARHAFKI